MTKQSTIDTLSLHLVPQQKPVAAINAKFCHPDSVTLHLHEKFRSLTGDDFTIKDATSGADVFRIKGTVFSLHEKKTLLDSSGVAIVNMKEEIFALTPNYNVYAGKDSHNMLFKIQAKLTILETSLRVEFTDVVTGQRCLMGLEGDWCSRKALIWLDRGKTGVRVPVGKIYRPLTASGNLLFGTQDYYMEITPNVDAALMVLICIVLDEKASDFMRVQPLDDLTDAAKDSDIHVWRNVEPVLIHRLTHWEVDPRHWFVRSRTSPVEPKVTIPRLPETMEANFVLLAGRSVRELGFEYKVETEYLIIGGASANLLAVQVLSVFVPDIWQVKERPIHYSVVGDSYMGIFPKDKRSAGSVVDFRYCSFVPVVFEITHMATSPPHFMTRSSKTGLACFQKERKWHSGHQTLVDVTYKPKMPILNVMKTAFLSEFNVRPGAAKAGLNLLKYGSIAWS